MNRIEYLSAGIENTKDFFGRQKIIGEICRRIESGQSISIYGERKIGKTSLLNYLFNVAIRHASFPNAEQFVVLRIFFAEKQDISQNDFLQRLYYELRRQSGHTEELEIIDFLSFERFIKALFHRGNRFIFFFDDMDAEFDNSFFSYLRSLSEMYKVQYIIASRKSLKQLLDEDNVVSPFSGLFSGNSFKLSVFDQDESVTFCDKLSKDAFAGSRISNERIMDLAGGHPFLLRLAFYHAVNLCIESDDNSVDYGVLKTIFEKESFHAYLYDVWSHMAGGDRKLLRSLAVEESDTDLNLIEKGIEEDFISNGLITRGENAAIHFFNAYFSEFIREWEHGERKAVRDETPLNFDVEIFRELLKQAEDGFDHPAKDAGEKGESLEKLVTYLFSAYEDYFSVRHQVHSRTASLDHHLWFMPGDDPVLRKFGDEIIVECKNWNRPVGKPEINDLAGDMVARKCKTGVMIARKGITGKHFNDANGQRLIWFQSDYNLIILVLTFADLESISNGKNLMDLLKDRYAQLVEG